MMAGGRKNETMENDDVLAFRLPVQRESEIKVIGVGGGGSNAVNHMCRQGIRDVEFVVCNTDLQALRLSPVKNRIQLGKKLAEGRGAGCVPERGRQSAEESMDIIKNVLTRKTKMVFITAGMGGGTGTGAAPEIAKLAKKMGILTVGIVTLPFSFEGRKKMEQAMNGIEELEENVDALLIIQNDKLRDIYGNLKLSEAFAMADNVLTIAAKSIAEIVTVKEYVNVNFAHVDGVMRNSGVALMGAAEAEGDNRAMAALDEALTSPLLNSHDIRGASNVLVNVLYGEQQVTMDEIASITESLQDRVGGNVDVIWGAGHDATLGNRLRVAVIAVGFNRNSALQVPSPEVPVEPEKAPEEDFKVEEIPEDLELELVDSAAVERDARDKRIDEAKKRAEAGKGTKGGKVAKGGKTKLGVNEIPDQRRWFDRLFEENSSKDAEMK